MTSQTSFFSDDFIKICSQCEDFFNIQEAKYRDIWQLPLCNKCFDQGKKPLSWPSHWNWKKHYRRFKN